MNIRYGQFLNFIWLGILLTLSSCSESQTPPNHQPMTLKMDVPRPKRLPQSIIKSKTVPHVQKSDMKFKSDPDAASSRVKLIPIQDLESCLNAVVRLETIKDQMQTNGGLWGRMEQVKNFKKFSPIGMQIDSRINKIVYSLRHLCKTSKGLDYSPLAQFVLESLKNKSEAEFKHEMIKKGESKTDAEIYLNYARVAQKAKNRSIRYSAIQPSVVKGGVFVKYYQAFYNRFQTETESTDSLMPDIMAFMDALDLFLSEDENIKIAVKEDFEKPFWMVDGDM